MFVVDDYGSNLGNFLPNIRAILLQGDINIWLSDTLSLLPRRRQPSSRPLNLTPAIVTEKLSKNTPFDC